VKRRKGRAPEGSGAPVGTAYDWYIVAHQIVTKLDANSYTTEMAGVKYKVAHRRADKTTWSASDRARRKRTVQILREMIAEIEAQERHETTAVEPRAPRLASRRRTKATARRRPPARPVRHRTKARRRAISGR
jgi:hypothetical protein